MRLPKKEECQSKFELEYGLGDDLRQYFHPYPKKPGPFSYHLRLNHVLRTFLRLLPRPAKVADLACANGNFALRLAELGYEVTALDLIPDFLQYTKRKYTQGKISYIEGNLMEFSSQQPFDGILMGEVIEHVAWPEKLIETAHRNLKTGGVFILTTPNGDYGANDLPTYKQISADRSQFEKLQFSPSKHLFLYTPKELKELLQLGGFKDIEIQAFNSHHLTQRTVLRYLLPMKALEFFDTKLSGIPYQRGSSANMLIASAKKI